MNSNLEENFDKLRQELRRGTVVLAVLSQLEEEQYGYSLISNLNEQGFEIGQDTLYPLLRRLEGQGLLVSQWHVEEPRPRRYYQLNDAGREMLVLLKAEWQQQEKVMRSLLDENE